MFKFFSSRAQIRPKLSRRPRKKIFSRKSQKNHRIFTFFAILHIFTFKCTLKFPTLNRLNFFAKFCDFPKKGRTFFWPIFNLHESVWKTQKKIYVASWLNFKKIKQHPNTLIGVLFFRFFEPVINFFWWDRFESSKKQQINKCEGVLFDSYSPEGARNKFLWFSCQKFHATVQRATLEW